MLNGKKVLITLGATIEAIDPVRYISNHSSGKMGMALARACIRAGAETTLIVGAISVPTENKANIINVTSADEMHDEVLKNIYSQDIFISCAAVADFKPLEVSENKIKKESGLMSIDLTKNRDILEAVSKVKNKTICIGFAAETEDFIDNATRKLKNKKCDAIILNDISNSEIGFNSDENEVYFITQEKTEKIDRNSKEIIAEKIIEKVTKNFF